MTCNGFLAIKPINNKRKMNKEIVHRNVNLLGFKEHHQESEREDWDYSSGIEWGAPGSIPSTAGVEMES